MEEQARAGAANPPTGARPAATKTAGHATTQQAAAQSGASATPPPGTQAGGGPGQPDHHHGADCLRICGSRDLPKADETLEQRHKDLEQALHGPLGQLGRRKYNWNGRNQVTLTFDSIEKLLDKAFPPERPESDIPGQPVETKKAGS